MVDENHENHENHGARREVGDEWKCYVMAQTIEDQANECPHAINLIYLSSQIGVDRGSFVELTHIDEKMGSVAYSQGAEDSADGTAKFGTT